MPTTEQGVWYQAMVNGKQVWHFYPNEFPGYCSTESKEQLKLAYPPQSKEATRRCAKEALPPTTKVIYETAVNFQASNGCDHTQIPTSTAIQALGGPSYHNNPTYNIYNTYNYAAPEPVQVQEAAAVQIKPEAQEEEGVRITEEEVKLDAMLHEQVQAIHQFQYLHTVDYGSGDVYGRRYIRREN